MKKTLWLTCLAVLAYGVPSSVARAEEKKPEAKQEAAPAMNDKDKAEFAKKADLFVDVAAYGEAQKDPLVLLTAVKMLDELPFDTVSKGDDQGKSGAKYDRDTLLSLAKQHAAGDAELLAVIAKLQDAPEPTAVRGRHDRDHDRWGRGYYYERRFHERHFGCNWYRVCHHGHCDWVCGH